MFPFNIQPSELNCHVYSNHGTVRLEFQNYCKKNQKECSTEDLLGGGFNTCPAEPGYVLPLQTVQIQISWLLRSQLI